MDASTPDEAAREIATSRVLPFPRGEVYAAITDPQRLARWWGPDGFTNTITKMDMKEGGEWDLVMHGPDGTDYKNKSIFREIVKHKKIVYDHETGPKFTTTITFEARGEKTHITWHMLFESRAVFIQTVKTFKADEGLKQNIERLNAYAEKILAAK